MANGLILSLITTISTYCGTVSDLQSSKRRCFKKIWICGHQVKDSEAIITETHNCITKHVQGKLVK